MTKEREQLMNEWAEKYIKAGEVNGLYMAVQIFQSDAFKLGFKVADEHPTEREMKLVEALEAIKGNFIRRDQRGISQLALSEWNSSKVKIKDEDPFGDNGEWIHDTDMGAR